MRTVSGPTDHVVVVGAGLGGLSAALRLAGAGRRVTLLEREDVPCVALVSYLVCDPVSPLYRAQYADGSSLDVHADLDAMADSIAALCGPAEAAGYRQFVDFVSQLYRLEMRDFIDRNIDSPLSLLRPSLARLAALDCVARARRAEQRRLEIAAHGIGVESRLRPRQIFPNRRAAERIELRA